MVNANFVQKFSSIVLHAVWYPILAVSATLGMFLTLMVNANFVQKFSSIVLHAARAHINVKVAKVCMI